MKVLRTLCAAALCSATVRAFSPSAARVPSVAVPTGLTVRYMSASPADFVKSEVESNKVTIFSKDYCPFCKKTKKVFNKLGVEATIFELNKMDDGSDIQAALAEMTGQSTVPNVFIKGEHLGGNDDTQAALKSGKLEEMLQ